jgi:hypothetical protein
VDGFGEGQVHLGGAVRCAAILFLTLLAAGCTRFARVEYGYPSHYLDSTGGSRLRPFENIMVDAGPGYRYDAASGDAIPIGQTAFTWSIDRLRLRGQLEATIPEVRWSGSIGVEVEF